MMNKKDVYHVGAKKVSQDVNIFNILQTLLKLKATVTVLVSNQADIIERIQKVYFDNSTLFLDEEDAENFKESKSEF